MRSSWVGLFFCLAVIYLGIVQSTSNPMVLLNPHALILVIGGTVAIAFLTYSYARLSAVMDFIVFGFLFKKNRDENTFAKDLIAHIDNKFKQFPTFEISESVHPFIKEADKILQSTSMTYEAYEATLKDRRNAVKRRYLEDAKILNNIAKYPPHLGLLGAASGMIEMMSGLGTSGVDTIGASMAVALSATLWGVGLNNFVFLPLADNSTKASEDELYQRDIVIECYLMIKRKEPHEDIVKTCLNRLDLVDRGSLSQEYRAMDQSRRGQPYVA